MNQLELVRIEKNSFIRKSFLYLLLLIVIFILLFFVLKNNHKSRYVFTVDGNYGIRKKEYCRSFDGFSKNYINSQCVNKGESVYFCNGSEVYYILLFRDKESCNAVLEMIKKTNYVI